MNVIETLIVEHPDPVAKKYSFVVSFVIGMAK